MSENLSSGGKKVSSLLRRLLFIYAFVLGIYLGGATFETTVLVPMWSASPDAARYFNQNPLSVFNTGNFFFIVAPLSTLLSIVTLIAGWRAEQPVRFWIRAAIIPFLIIFLITAFYFVPEQGAIKGAAAQSLPDAELTARASRWVMLNWIRQALALPILGATLHALGLAYRQSAKTND
ncbi:MAG: DUF1772 domain-containing protein [Acidobacteriota bacterium]|nr:DUF1772 domain-containing protein [Acidobacteriota bacterium]